MQPAGPGTHFVIEVNPRIPQQLARLEELANDLRYSWDPSTRAIFSRLNPGLWDALGHRPKALLKRVDEKRLLEAAADPAYLNDYNRVLSAYDAYHAERSTRADKPPVADESNVVAYFCAEFGFHESLPIYSGGLGILAGDHCKAAGDIHLPLVGVGLLYRQGYFHQTIDSDGSQRAEYHDSDFDDLPILRALREDGSELHVQIELPGRGVAARIWQVRIGRVKLYLLDTDLKENASHDRGITFRLYGGDRTTRIEQELVLGIGGVRALEALGVKPRVWHINEGHAAFLILERIRGAMRQGLEYDAALEAVAANTVFTTHTAVPAGHDHFSEEMIRAYLAGLARDLGLAPEKLLALGQAVIGEEFNMTSLAVRGSRHQNGVSRIHREVSAEILRGMWAQIPVEESPLAHVTNSVHTPTFLAVEWFDVFDRFIGHDWSNRLGDAATWARLSEVPDQIFWSTRQHLKSQMLHLIRYRLGQQDLHNHGSEAHLARMLRLADPENPNVLTIGIGRRFATYKRATLLFKDLDSLRALVSDAERPLLFIFAGKAHPADVPGQDLMRDIMRVAKMPEFEGRILLVEGYDLQLARRMVSGVDVWLNTPLYPLEASGTSGMKAGINGVINLSVLDGWWGEGYEGDNGWAIRPVSTSLERERRDREEAHILHEILRHQVIPMYYDRGSSGYSATWIAMAKRSMASVLPRFTSSRMLHEYASAAYLPAARQGRRLTENGFAGARLLAAWKKRVREAWPGVAVRRLDTPAPRMAFGEKLCAEVGVRLNGLTPADLIAEMVLSHEQSESGSPPAHHALTAAGAATAEGEQLFRLEIDPALCGKLGYRLRVYPCHDLLTHPLELGLMLWV